MTVADRFSVCQHTTWHQSFEEDIELYSDLGVPGIELCERKLSPNRARQLEQLALVDAAGIEITTVQPSICALFPDSMYPDMPDPHDRMARFRQTIDLLAEAYPGRELTLVTVTGKAPALDFARGHRMARALYPPLCDYAAERGMRIAFEPHSPVLMNTDTFICTLDEALRLIEDVGRPNFGLLLDTWHVWREPGIAERIAPLGDTLFAVHVSDWPAGEPRCQGDRKIPGEGVIDLPSLLGAIDRSGYGGAACLEIFSADVLPDSLWHIDQAELITRGRAGLKRASQLGSGAAR